MKKTVSVFIGLLICIATFALGFEHPVEKHDFDSDVMLENFFSIPEESNSSWDDVKVSLLTLSKGDELYSWFGHTALLVERPNSSSVFYDYGRFAFSSAFYINFIKGVLWYRCGAYYASSEIARFTKAERTISKLELNLTAEQKEAVVNFLSINSTSPYNQYLYHHFEDNCATRVRDILNVLTDGDFKAWAEQQDGISYRAQTSRILHRYMPIEWVLDFVQGPSVDKEATLWDEMFLPENLEKAVLNYGKLTKEQTYIADFRSTDTRPANYEKPQAYVNQSLFVGCILAILLMIFYKCCPKLFITENSILVFLLGIFGSILFYMMFFSGHSFSWNNENILFVNPLLIVAFILGFKHKKHNKVLTSIYGALTAITVGIIVIKYVSPQTLTQDNFPQLFAVLPLYMANFAICLSEVL